MIEPEDKDRRKHLQFAKDRDFFELPPDERSQIEGSVYCNRASHAGRMKVPITHDEALMED